VKERRFFAMDAQNKRYWTGLLAVFTSVFLLKVEELSAWAEALKEEVELPLPDANLRVILEWAFEHVRQPGDLSPETVEGMRGVLARVCRCDELTLESSEELCKAIYSLEFPGKPPFEPDDDSSSESLEEDDEPSLADLLTAAEEERLVQSLGDSEPPFLQ
jgi:hypothetical protein